MFKPEQRKTWIETGPDQVAYISTSVNRPIVVPPGRAPEAAQAYVCILRTARGYEFYIYLHLIASNLGLLYRWDVGAMPKEMVPQVQQAAAEFTESMGFMMTDLRWRELGPEQKTDSFNSLPLFFQDISRFQEQTEEEVLEIEPVKDEIVVESIEEPVQTVTEGDFVIHEEGYAESKPEREVVFDEIPDIPVQPEAQAPAKKPGRAASEEDILLESLEVKEEPPSAPSPALQARAQESELLIEIEEAPAPAELKKPEPEPISAAAQPLEEIVWEKELAEPGVGGAAAIAEPEIAINLEAETAPAPAPVTEVEEISIDLAAEPETEPGSAPAFEPEPEAPRQAEPEPEPAAVMAEPRQGGVEPALASAEPVPEIIQAEKSGPETSVPAESGQRTETELTDEDFKLMIRFLAMF